MTIRQIIEFGPEYSTWADWNGNLVHYFGEETIPYIAEEDHWQEVARNVVQLPTFMNYATPDPDAYTNWQDWALAFIQIVNGPTL
jgi:hypothetical protein